MPLATRNNALIVKDGRLAENCNCCGWYCYPDTNTCPCFYAKAMPSALNAHLDFTLSDTIYGAALGNFIAATVQCTRLTPAQASTISGSYSLARMSAFGRQCDYRYESDTLTIEVRVGAVCQGEFNAFTVALRALNFVVPATAPVWPGPDAYSGQINSQCNGVPGFLTNAASRSYGENIALSCPAPPFQNYCASGGPFPFHNRSMQLGAAPAGRDNPPCSTGVIEEIDHQWAIDILYTDTSGASPQLGTVSRAITLSVTE